MEKISGIIGEIIAVIYQAVAGTSIGDILAIIALVCAVITHVVPHLPVSVTEKVPNSVMLIINTIAGQYLNSKNEASDIYGNKKLSSDSIPIVEPSTQQAQ